MHRPPRNLSISRLHRVQVSLVVMPAQSRQMGWWSGARPGSMWVSRQRGHLPRVWVASVKQAPQTGPSGQRTLILATSWLHRLQR